jgi:predicted nucleic acid-binding protein
VGYLLDTNIVIHARDGTDPVLEKLARHHGNVLISALVLVELQRGIHGKPLLSEWALRRLRLEAVLEHMTVLPFDTAAALAYGRIIAQCGWVRRRDTDRMIAAHAVSSDSVLVTNNVADFSDIPGLTIENWVVPS